MHPQTRQLETNLTPFAQCAYSPTATAGHHPTSPDPSKPSPSLKHSMKSKPRPSSMLHGKNLQLVHSLLYNSDATRGYCSQVHPAMPYFGQNHNKYDPSNNGQPHASRNPIQESLRIKRIASLLQSHYLAIIPEALNEQLPINARS